MSLYIRKTYIAAKIEASYGVDSAPVAANAIKISNATIAPLSSSAQDRALMRQTLGASPKIQTDIHRKTEFSTEIVGAGGAGTAPGYANLLRACGLAETVSAGVDVSYSPVSEGFESTSIYYYLDGQLRKLLGSRGTVGLSFQSGQVPQFKFQMVGLWSQAANSAAPAPVYTGFAELLHVSKVNTPTFTFGGVALPMDKLDINLGTNPKHRDMVNLEDVSISDRQSQGTVTFEWPALATLDVETLAKSGTLSALQLIHGTAAGGIVQIDAPKVQLLNPQPVDMDGVAMCQAELLFTPNAGDDELTITVK